MSQSYVFWSLFFLAFGAVLGLLFKAMLHRRRR
jgi:hypothetical protein